MTPEEMKARARRNVEEGWNKGNPAVFGEYYAPNFVYHNPTYPQVKDLESYSQWVADVRTSYPDMHFTIDEMIVAGDRVIARFTWEGTSKGESILAGTPPTGKHGAMAGIWIDRYEGDKVVEEWVVQDSLGLMQQLGYGLKKEGEK